MRRSICLSTAGDRSLACSGRPQAGGADGSGSGSGAPPRSDIASKNHALNACTTWAVRPGRTGIQEHRAQNTRISYKSTRQSATACPPHPTPCPAWVRRQRPLTCAGGLQPKWWPAAEKCEKGFDFARRTGANGRVCACAQRCVRACARTMPRRGVRSGVQVRRLGLTASRVKFLAQAAEHSAHGHGSAKKWPAVLPGGGCAVLCTRQCACWHPSPAVSGRIVALAGRHMNFCA